MYLQTRKASYFTGRNPVVNICIHTTMISQIQLIVKIIHCTAVDMRSVGMG